MPSAGQAAPFSLWTYEEARKRGRQIRDVIDDGYMPPWHATSEHLAFSGDRRLSPEQKSIIQKWYQSGMPEGDRELAPIKPRFNEDWAHGTPDLVVTMPEAYEVYAEGRDIYRNFVLPLNNDKTLFLKAIEIRPSARSVVHHVLYFVDSSGAARKKDEEDPLPGFRGMGFTSMLTGIGGWAVGGMPQPLPDGMAFELPPGSDIVLQTHFHPSGKVEKEATSLGLYLTDSPPTRDFTGIQLPPRFGALAGVDIPPGDPHYVVEDSFTLPVDVEAFAVSAHAHYLGKSMLMTAKLPDGKELELLRIDDWDFNWQEAYAFKNPLTLPAGTQIAAHVVWDNSDSNPANPHNPPQRVRWGPFSYDEMGSITLRVSPVKNDQIQDIRAALGEHQTLAIAKQVLASAQDKSNSSENSRRNFFENRLLQFDLNKNGRFEADEERALMETVRSLRLRLGERLNNSF
ncbi:MAG: hypothetical protein LR011_07920 [Verrucomicrobia bacterium]|nr:hypothetical protein [Verrucomicrobiota bacterium]